MRGKKEGNEEKEKREPEAILLFISSHERGVHGFLTRIICFQVCEGQKVTVAQSVKPQETGKYQETAKSKLQRRKSKRNPKNT